MGPAYWKYKHQSGFGIAADRDGNQFIIGSYDGDLAFENDGVVEQVITSTTGLDLFLARFDVEGVFDWAAEIESNTEVLGTGITALADGTSYVTGQYEGNVVLGVGEANDTRFYLDSNQRNSFFASYNSNGMLNWARTIRLIRDGNFYPTVESKGIAVHESGKVYAVGDFNGTIVFGEGEQNQTHVVVAPEDRNTSFVFVSKFDSDGDILWANKLGREGAISHGISVDYAGSVYVVGTFFETITFAEGEVNERTINSVGEYDLFLAKYLTDGTFAWATTAGGEGTDRAYDVVVDAHGSSL